MLLKKITIKNIRCHEYFEFVPKINGVTSISGENGKGKSTIVDSLSWVLFGTRLHGLKNSSYIREGVDPKVDEVSAEAIIIVGNREYKIKKQIKNASGTSEVNIYSKELNSDEDYKFDCGPAISHAENYIKKLLGFNEKGFFASTFVQQKQVDQIISSTPKERGEVIEQLIGISAITEAINIAKEQIKDLQKSASLIQHDNLEDKEKILKKLEIMKKEVEEKYNKTKITTKEIETRFLNKEKEYNQETKKQERFEEIDKRRIYSENNIRILNNSLSDKIVQMQNLGNDNLDIKDYDTIEKKYKEIVDKDINIKTNISVLSKQVKDLEELFSNKITKEVLDNYKKYTNKLEEIEKTINSLKISISIIENKIKDNNTFVEKIHNGIKECPFCGQEILNVEKEKEKHLVFIKNFQEELEQKIQESTALNKKKEQLEKLINNNKEKILIKQEQNNKKNIYKETKEQLQSLIKEEKKASVELSVIKEQYDKAKISKHNIENLNKIKEEIKILDKQLKKENKDRDTIDREIKDLDAINKNDYKKLFREYNNLNKQLTECKMNLVKTESELKLIEEKEKEAKLSYKNTKEAIKKYTELMNKLELLNTVYNTLIEFKKERIETSIPALTDIASNLYSRFTNNEFTSIQLDNQFRSYATTKDGVERPVAQLSGGELSAAAIALRLAIAMFLHRDKQNLLILDEVLVSMSEDRSQLILETIKSFSNSQIIFIAHSDVANSFADKIVELN